MLVLGALALALGCATVPSIPLADIRAIEGKWRGTITVGKGSRQFYYLTVNPDSTIVAEWGMNWQWGAITLSGGNARFELSHLTSGTLRYFDGKDGRVITMTPDFGGWYVYVTPLK
jgi:uncharacterized protein YndB with AHSA1/START domain